MTLDMSATDLELSLLPSRKSLNHDPFLAGVSAASRGLLKSWTMRQNLARGRSGGGGGDERTMRSHNLRKTAKAMSGTRSETSSSSSSSSSSVAW